MTDSSPHVPDSVLLRILDGELSGRAAAAATSHLETCWSCRAERDRMVALIGDIVDFRDRAFEPAPADAGRPLFTARLRERLDSDQTGEVTTWWSEARRWLAGPWRMRTAAVATLLIIWIGVATPSGAARAVSGAIRWVVSVAFPAPPARTPPLAKRTIVSSTPVAAPTVAGGPAPRPATSRPPSPAFVNPIDLHLEALWELHRVGALLGEEIVITRGTSKLSILVRVENASRKTTVRSALASVVARGARVQVETFTEAARTTPPAFVPSVSYHEVAATAVAAAEREFSIRMLDIARQITLHAFALQRLHEQLPPEALREASEPARVTYAVLVREYSAAIDARVQTFVSDLEAAYGQMTTPSAEPGEAGDDSMATAALRLEDDVRRTFGVQAGPGEEHPPDPNRLRRLAERVRQIAIGLRQKTFY